MAGEQVIGGAIFRADGVVFEGPLPGGGGGIPLTGTDQIDAFEDFGLINTRGAGVKIGGSEGAWTANVVGRGAGLHSSTDGVEQAWLDVSGTQAVLSFDGGVNSVVTIDDKQAYFTMPVRLPDFTTALRPAAGTLGAGVMIYDSTLKLPIIVVDGAWKKFDGTAA